MGPPILSNLKFSLLVAVAACILSVRGSGVANEHDMPGTLRLGQRLFNEARFSYIRVRIEGCLSARDVVEVDGFESLIAQARANDAGPQRIQVSCRLCHYINSHASHVRAQASPPSAFADPEPRSPIPPRSDGRTVTLRNSPSLVDALAPADGPALMHFDAEFASAEALVKETFLGRNFGWLPGERAEALQQFARVIRQDDGSGDEASGCGHFSYSALLRGNDPAIPSVFRLPSEFRIDPATVSDEEILDACARLVVEYMRTLRFFRDERGSHNGSPYDAFLAANRLPRAPARDQITADYSRRLGEQVAVLRAPQWVDDPSRALRSHNQQRFRFGALEFEGLQIFFRSALGPARKSGAGNCAECHVAPFFTDFKFHNTGAAQDEYDIVHGLGSFERLPVPSATTRDAGANRQRSILPEPSFASGQFASVPELGSPEKTDLGVWSVYGNPALPTPQFALNQLFNPTGQASHDDVLARMLGRFKTSTVRNLGSTAPYLHTGQLRSIEEVIGFYARMSELAHTGRMRNAPAEYFGMRIGPGDVAPLAAFLRALNEDFSIRNADELAGDVR